MVTSKNRGEPRAVDRAGHPFSGLQAIDRNGIRMVLEQGSGALRVKASSKGLQPEGLGMHHLNLFLQFCSGPHSEPMSPGILR